MSWIKRIQSIPMYIIYLLFILAVTLPLFFPLGLPITIGTTTRAAYDFVESLPEGSIVVFNYDINPGNQAELGSGAKAITYHMFRKNMKVVFFNLEAQAPQYVARDIPPMEEELGKTYGVDWVSLGYVAGGESAMAAFLTDIKSLFTKDFYGTPLKDIPLMNEINNYEKTDMVIYSGTGGNEQVAWIRQAVTPYGIPLIEVPSGEAITTMMPYFPAQMVGMIGSIRGSAEYEYLINKPGPALAGMDSLSIATLYVIALVILNNVGKLLERGKGGNS